MISTWNGWEISSVPDSIHSIECKQCKLWLQNPESVNERTNKQPLSILNFSSTTKSEYWIHSLIIQLAWMLEEEKTWTIFSFEKEIQVLSILFSNLSEPRVCFCSFFSSKRLPGPISSWDCLLNCNNLNFNSISLCLSLSAGTILEQSLNGPSFMNGSCLNGSILLGIKWTRSEYSGQGHSEYTCTRGNNRLPDKRIFPCCPRKKVTVKFNWNSD